LRNDEAVLRVIDAFTELNIPYMIVGALSSNYYGIERSTRDADFVVEMDEAGIETLAEQLGDQFVLDPQMTFEGVTGQRRYTMAVRDSVFSIEFFLLGDDSHARERFARRVKLQYLDRDVYVPTAEDVVVTKVRWLTLLNRLKDEDDLRNVIAVQGSSLDWEYIERWATAHGSRNRLEQVRADVPEIELGDA